MSNGSRFEVEDPRFRDDRTEERQYAPVEIIEEPPPRRGCLKNCLGGCLITGLVLLILGVIAAVWISRHWREFASKGLSTVVKQGIDATELPVQEKVEMGVQVDRVAAAFREGRLSQEQLGVIMQDLMDSPLMTTLAASAIESKYITRSGLTDEEKMEGRQTLRRYLRGAIDHKIDQEGIDAAMVHVADREPDGKGWQLRDRVSDDDLRAFFKEAKAQADKAAIPAEPEDVDPSDELKRIIDEAMTADAPQPK